MADEKNINGEGFEHGEDNDAVHVELTSLDADNNGHPEIVSTDVITENGGHIRAVEIDLDSDGQVDAEVISVSSSVSEFLQSEGERDIKNEGEGKFETDESTDEEDSYLNDDDADGVEIIDETVDSEDKIRLADMYDSGVVDTVLVDLDGDGVVDEEHAVEIIDTDEDGFGDQVVDADTGEIIGEDRNQDGVIDMMDKDSDGELEEVGPEENIDGHLTVDQEREDYFVDEDSSSAVGWHDEDPSDGIHAEWDSDNTEVFVSDDSSDVFIDCDSGLSDSSDDV